MGYRTSSSLEHGAYMYEMAIDEYLRHLSEYSEGGTEATQDSKVVSGEMLDVFNIVQFFLIALGHIHVSVASLSTPPHTISETQGTTMWDIDVIRQIAAVATNDLEKKKPMFRINVGYLQLLAIAWLRSEISKNVQRSNENQDYELEGSKKVEREGELHERYKKLLREQETILVGQMGKDPDQLWHTVLSRTHVLSMQDMPESLTSGIDSSMPRPEEWYMFLQDCFFWNGPVDQVLRDLIEWYE